MNAHLSTAGRYDSMVSSESEVDIGEFDHDDILESKMHGHSSRKKTRRELVQELLEELESAELNKMLGMASFAFASAAVIFGIFNPLEHINGTYRVFAALAALFLLNQSFFIVKTIREQEIEPYKNLHGKIVPDWHFLQGRVEGTGMNFHTAVLYGSFPFALGCFFFGLHCMDAHLTTKFFLGLSTLYMWSSSLNFAMMLRDKFEAKVWESEVEGRHIGSKKVELAAKNVMNTLRYHQRGFQFVFFLIGVTGILAVVWVLVHWLSKEDEGKGIGLFTASMFMCIMASWNLARVLNAEHKVMELSVIVSFTIAITLGVVGLFVVKFDMEHKIILVLAQAILIDSTFNFAKVQHRVKAVNKLVKVVQRKFHMEWDAEDGGEGGGHGGGHGASTSARDVSTSKPAGGAPKPGKKK